MVLHQRPSVAHPLRAADLHHRVTAEPTEARGTSIHTDLEPVPARAPQGVTAHCRDQSPRGRDLDLLLDDVAVDETVLVAMGAEDEEVRVIAATVVMMIEAGADLVDGVEDVNKICGQELEVNNGFMVYSDGVWGLGIILFSSD